jgi:YD repeat-containing protein
MSAEQFPKLVTLDETTTGQPALEDGGLLVSSGSPSNSTTVTKRFWSPQRVVLWGTLVVVVVAWLAGWLVLRRLTWGYPAVIRAEDVAGGLRAARFDGTYPCVAASVSQGSMTTALGRCAMPLDHHGAVDRLEADLRYGSFVVRQTDLGTEDGLDVPLTRAYTSDDWISANPVHAFGRNSNHPYDIAPLGTRNPYTEQELVLEDGDIVYFKRISPGTGFGDAVFLHTDTSTRFYSATTAWNGNGWTARLRDGSTIVFPESYNAKNLAQGAATEMTDAAGRKLELKRDDDRNLEKIVAPKGRWIRFAHDGLARITRAEDDHGHWATYTYNGDGLLASVVHSAGGERHYTYQGELMTEVRDERGRVLVQNTYDRGWLVRQAFGNGDLYAYRYHGKRGTRYAESVEVTLPSGEVREVAIGGAVPSLLLE